MRSTMFVFVLLVAVHHVTVLQGHTILHTDDTMEENEGGVQSQHALPSGDSIHPEVEKLKSDTYVGEEKALEGTSLSDLEVGDTNKRTIDEGGKGGVSAGDDLVKEFTSAFINMSYVDINKNLLYSERKAVGRYSSGGVGYATGVATKLFSEDYNSSIAELACSLPLQYKPTQAPMIAIIKRGLCTFDTKVKNAASVGAAGVLIYDNIEEDRLKTIQVSAGSIPTVFTYQWMGEDIERQLTLGQTVFIALELGSHCRIQGEEKDFYCTKSADWTPGQSVFNYQDPFGKRGDSTTSKSTPNSVLFVSISFLILIIISMVWLLFYYIQRFRFIHNKDELERRMGRQAKQALSHVALVVLGEEGGECTVCLDTLRGGEEVRRLPCSHTFHRPCIDNWLLSKRKCPLCNLNIVDHFGLSDLEDRDDNSTDSQAANTAV